MHMRLWATDLHLSFRAVTPVVLPFHAGSLIRGVLGRALHGTSFYERLFAPQPPADHPFLRRGGGAPPALLPILPSPQQRAVAAGAALPLRLRLLASLSPKELSALQGALHRMAASPWRGAQVRCEAVEVASPRVIALAAPAVGAEKGDQPLQLRLVTPLWLEQAGEVRSEVTVLRLCRSAFWRFTTLCGLYGEVDPAHRELLLAFESHAQHARMEAQVAPLRWRRESTERQQGHAMEGLLGSLSLHDAAPLRSLLEVAEQIHLGKHTSFGLGRVHVGHRHA